MLHVQGFAVAALFAGFALLATATGNGAAFLAWGALAAMFGASGWAAMRGYRWPLVASWVVLAGAFVRMAGGAGLTTEDVGPMYILLVGFLGAGLVGALTLRGGEQALAAAAPKA